MATFDIKNVSVKGLSACVPSNKESVKDIYHWDGVDTFISSTGIEERRIAGNDITTSDLCCVAAESLINSLGWERNDIDALIFVTQTPDYILPATSCILQTRLNLPMTCFTLDISLGCSGWVYGLSVLSSLLQTGQIKRGLLLAGDTPSKKCSKEDKSSYPLFGDAGTATALEFDSNASQMKFLMQTDGEGFEDIIIKDGGRNQLSANSFAPQHIDDGIIRSRAQVELNGMNIFSFGITKVPKAVKSLCSKFEIDINNIDVFSFHQANLKMNEIIRTKLKLPKEKVAYSMDEFGNTSSASIPLTLVTQNRNQLMNNKIRHIACGFGVGLSWGTVAFETDRIVVPELLEI